MVEQSIEPIEHAAYTEDMQNIPYTGPSVVPETLEEIEHLLTLVRSYLMPDEVTHVIRALHLAQEKCRGVIGSRPIPPLEHALAVSTILAQLMHADAIGVAAGLVFEAVDADLLAGNVVENELGGATARVIISMSRLNILERRKQSVAEAKAQKPSDERDEQGQNTSAETKKPRVRENMRRQQAETVRKMFIAMAEDPRVVLMKLAYRLHAMRLVSRSAYAGDRQENLTMALETREIYAPLAGRLGMSRIESELEDLAFKVLEPDKYAWVHDVVEEESKQWRSYVADVCAILDVEMKSINVKADVSGRVKHLYSFYKKLHRNAGDVEDLEEIKKAADISQIHDLIAFRILVDTTQDCYIALGHVHSLWKPKEGRIKDFIANPKPNGYSALHTTVFCKDDQLVEVQIRTHEMHEAAEYGVAMHWHYKDVGDSASSSAKELLSWLRQMTEWQREMHSSTTSDTDFVEAVKDDILQEQIFIFTPHGEVKDLPVGSTPIDFAYRVHTKIGDTYAGARVTNSDSSSGERLITRMVPLDYVLNSGDVVEIVTSRTAHPTHDWLTVARTAAAQSKIRRYLKIHERHINIQIGRDRLDRELKVLGARGMESMTEDAGKWLSEEYRLHEFEDLLAAIGANDVRPHSVAVKVTDRFQLRETKEPKESKEQDELPNKPSQNTRPGGSGSLQIDGVGLLTKLANCCCPLPGDDIIGFISRGKGVIVHRENCHNLKRFRERDKERLITVSWSGISQARYMAPIVIQACDRTGLFRDIATVVADTGVNMNSVGMSNSSRGSKREFALFTLTLDVDGLEQLYRVISRIEKVKDVISVGRNLGK